MQELHSNSSIFLHEKQMGTGNGLTSCPYSTNELKDIQTLKIFHEFDTLNFHLLPNLIFIYGI